MIEVDDQAFPLVIYRFEGEVSEAELEDYLTRQERIMARGQKSLALVIARRLKMWELRLIRRQAEWVKQHREVLRNVSMGVALVIDAPTVRGMLKVILAIQPMPQPHVVTATLDEALDWLRSRARLTGVTLPEPLALDPRITRP